MNDVNQLRASWVSKIEITHVDGVEVPGDCWLWHGYCDKVSGYGRVTVNKTPFYLHRFTYAQFVGPIPSGLHIDHLCRQRNCCAPHHLEAVTCLENVRRGIRASQTHCKNDHPLSGENVYIIKSPQGEHRQCRACRDARMAIWRAERKLRKAATWAKYLGDEVAS